MNSGLNMTNKVVERTTLSAESFIWHQSQLWIQITLSTVTVFNNY